MGGMRSYFAKETESGWQGNVQYCSLLHSQRSAERGKWPICDQFPLNFRFKIVVGEFFQRECRLFLSRPNLINPSTRLPEIDRINSDGATDSIVKQHITRRQWMKICSFNFSNSIRYLWHNLCIVNISSFNFYRPLREFLPCVSEKTLLDFSQFLVKK